MTYVSSASAGRRADRTAVLASLAGVTAIAWALTVQWADMEMRTGSMAGASAMAPQGHPFVLVFAMWAAMMVGMMVPSATPMIVAYADWTRRGPAAAGGRAGAIGSFLLGYLLVWVAFGAAAAILQMTLEHASLLTAGAAIGRPEIGGAVLVLAGLFQVTPWKESCLRRCRTPLGFLIAEWRDGASGALVMGIRHGAYCLGCCWLLMAVLLVVGTMNLLWMAALAVFVLAEKVAPRSLRIGHAAAVVLVGGGAWTIVTAGAHP